MLVWGIRSASKEKKVYCVLLSVTACDNKDSREAYVKKRKGSDFFSPPPLFFF